MLRPTLEQGLRCVAYGREQVCVAHQVGDLELQQARLSGSEHFTRTTQLEVFFRDNKTVIGLTHDAQPLPPDLRQWRVIQQHAVTDGTAASDASTQLVQLSQAEALGGFR